MCKWFGIKVTKNKSMKENIEFFLSRTLTPTFLRELKVLVNQLLGSDLTDDLLTLITYLGIIRCKKVRVCDEDDDLSLYLLEALVTG
jgi:hypothetical protein